MRLELFGVIFNILQPPNIDVSVNHVNSESLFFFMNFFFSKHKAISLFSTEVLLYFLFSYWRILQS